jgi:hypothetical protein
VIVVDVGGEEFDVTPVGGVADICDEGRHHYKGVGWGGERAGAPRPEFRRLLDQARDLTIAA